MNMESNNDNEKSKLYLGVKLISAEPCSQDQYAGAKNFGDLSKLSGGIDREGYKVVYEDGYTSWSPKDVFEKAYKSIKTISDLKSTKWFKIGNIPTPPHQGRVVTEMLDLDKKIEALDSFILSNPIYKTLPIGEQDRLVKQVQAMQYYFGILIDRINNF